jgi:hypothetical protein
MDFREQLTDVINEVRKGENKLPLRRDGRPEGLALWKLTNMGRSEKRRKTSSRAMRAEFEGAEAGARFEHEEAYALGAEAEIVGYDAAQQPRRRKQTNREGFETSRGEGVRPTLEERRLAAKVRPTPGIARVLAQREAYEAHETKERARLTRKLDRTAARNAFWGAFRAAWA